VFEYDGEASIIRMPWPTGGCCATVKKKRLLKFQGLYLDNIPVDSLPYFAVPERKYYIAIPLNRHYQVEQIWK
jgi:hypothetical protein